LTFIGLWTYVDDEGRGEDEPRLIKAALWPLDDDYTVECVDEDLELLAGAEFICRYKGRSGGMYLHVVNWKRHQYINRPRQSKVPACSVKAHGKLTEGSRRRQGQHTSPSVLEGKGKERKGISNSSSVMTVNGGPVDNSAMTKKGEPF
jgi:hypothetical protein